MAQIERILVEGSVAELREACGPAEAAAYRNPRGEASLWLAARNHDPQRRIELMAYLLDNGADARYSRSDGVGILHVMYSRPRHDFIGEAAITNRLVELGADINLLDGCSVTPLEELVRATANRAESDVAPIYSVVFSRAELNLFRESKDGTSAAERLLRTSKFRPLLAENVRAWLGRGLSPCQQ